MSSLVYKISGIHVRFEKDCTSKSLMQTVYNNTSINDCLYGSNMWPLFNIALKITYKSILFENSIK